ncbi:hypothetical protein FOL47_002354 [Perkinsus chesapeaki]|uniref:Uncharacterized protein n=1 Tax=Perkinsus chesapeaki TaxID=330153 RepID=A0A7J6KRI9_PERCH|nr:hypothetical protein FOL47_002354 [Perkinsus chesapeaki]
MPNDPSPRVDSTSSGVLANRTVHKLVTLSGLSNPLSQCHEKTMNNHTVIRGSKLTTRMFKLLNFIAGTHYIACGQKSTLEGYYIADIGTYDNDLLFYHNNLSIHLRAQYVGLRASTVYTYDEATGSINIDSKYLNASAETFPYVGYRWKSRYNSSMIADADSLQSLWSLPSWGWSLTRIPGPGSHGGLAFNESSLTGSLISDHGLVLFFLDWTLP